MMKQFPLTKFQKLTETATWGLALLTAVVTVVVFPRLPRLVATHFDAYGIANDWGGRWTVLLIPVLLAVCCGLVSLCARLPLRWVNLPFQVNLEREWFVLRGVRDMLCVLNAEVSLLFAVIQLFVLLQRNLPMGFVWGMVGFICATLLFGLWRCWKCNQGTL